MNTDSDLQRQVTSVFADAAPSGYPDELLARVLTTTSRARPRPGWLANIKEPPMRYPARVAVGSPTFRLASILALTLALILAAAGAVVAGASLLPSPPVPPPFGPAKNGVLAFDRDGDIYVADATGGHAHAIISGDTLDRGPWFSHDGSRFQFRRGPDGGEALMIADADGTNVQTVSATLPVWSDFMPSDDQLVETRTVDSHLVLSMASLDGSGTVRDLPLNGIQPTYWVEPRPPDGAEIIFTGNPAAGSTDVALYGIKPDGTGVRVIGAILATEAGDHDSIRSPALSPDGTTIAFWNFERAPGDTDPQMYLHLRDLTTGADLPIPFTGSSTAIGIDPQFSPDGKTMAFTRPVSAGSQQWQVYDAPLDGSHPEAPIGLDHPQDDNGGFYFSPDGTQVILSAWGSTWSIDVASGTATALSGIPVVPGWQRLAP